MHPPDGSAGVEARLLATLQQLLELPAAEVKHTLEGASMMVARAFGADKVDIFLYDGSSASLVARGTSDTPMGRREHELGLDLIPLANGGRAAFVYNTGESFATGRADEDEGMLRAVVEDLGVRSILLVPLYVDGERRGVLSVTWAQRDCVHENDLAFLQAVSRWVGMVLNRAELVERIAADAAERGRDAAARDIITVLAHDLGNYLTPLRGRIDLIRRRANREGRERDLQDADSASHALLRTQRLVNDLLDTSRMDRGVFALQRDRVNLSAMVRDTAEAMEKSETPIQVDAPNDVMADADEERIRRVLENLLSNAARYSPDGVPIVVTVGTETGNDGEEAVVTVQDKGPGIPADMLPRIFRRFSPGPESTGLGLGLYLARGLARAHGGTLTVESEPGGGATFFLRLPINSADPG